MTGPSTARDAMLAELLHAICSVRPEDRALVALDGVDGVGKTSLSRELIAAAELAGVRPLAGISIDGFHRPKRDRISAGSGPEGFYRGSYRYREFLDCVVGPLRAGRPLTPAVWDVARDTPVDRAVLEIPPQGVLLVDGIFLQRPELDGIWDATVWVDAPFAVTVPRANARFPGRHESDPEAHSNRRYVGGQRLYLEEVDPRSRATWIVDNTHLEHPVLLSGSARVPHRDRSRAPRRRRSSPPP